MIPKLANQTDLMTAPRDSKTRSILKGLTWRCLATLTTYLIAWLWTGEVETAGKIAAVEFVLKFAIYYAHERAWAMVPSLNKKASQSVD